MASIGIADKTTLDAVKTTVDDIASAGDAIVIKTNTIDAKADSIIDKIDNLDIGGGGGGTSLNLSNVEVFIFNSAMIENGGDERIFTKGGVDSGKHIISC